MNLKKKLFIGWLFIASSTGLLSADTISGFVRSNTGNGIANAVVSDGYSVVQTNSDGFYSFLRNDSTQFVFISVPEAYEIPLDKNGSPLLYARVSATGDFTHHFTLTPFADGGKADSTHVLFAISDPQVRNKYDVWRYRNETIKDIDELKRNYPEGTRFYGVVVGDLVWDDYARHEDHKASCEMLGIPVFQVIGNHDHDMYSCGDSIADHYFKEVFGPTYYSFNRGKIHYVVLDDIDYIGCNTKDYTNSITWNQINWLKKDLELVPTEKAVVILAHAPFEGSNVGNRQFVYNMLTGRRTTQHIISGHHHRLTNYEINNRLFDHTLGSAMGSCWSSDYCSDGTPNGYGVFEAGDKGFNEWYYKATGKSRNFQMNVYPVNSIDTHEGKTNCIIANVWNFDSRWSVFIYENGVKKVMQQYTGHDPMVYDLLDEEGDTRPNYPGSDGGTTVSQNPGSQTTGHMFSYKPTDPDANFIIEVTDRFGHVYRQSVSKHMMTASFSKENNEWTYHTDFNNLPRYANQFDAATKLSKGTFVQGHMPQGWYASTSGKMLPEVAKWGQFNYLRINNGDQADGWLYSYGNGHSETQDEHDRDRAFGSLVSTVSHRDICFGLVIENNTGYTIRSIEISYTGEMWRAGDQPENSQSLIFSYDKLRHNRDLRDRNKWIGELSGMTEVDSLSFHSPTRNTAAENGKKNCAINGNEPQNSKSITGCIDLNLEPGAVAVLRWEDTDDNGSDHGLAIDDLSLIARLDNNSLTKKPSAPQHTLYTIGKTVCFDQAPHAEVQVYDMTGQIIFRQTVNTTSIDLSNSTCNGVYIVRWNNKVQKVIL